MTELDDTTEVLRRPRDIAVLVPPGWVRIPTGPQRDSVIASIVARRAVHAPPAVRTKAASQLRRALRATMDRAETAGTLEALVLLDPIRGRNVSASCVISYVAGPTAPPHADLPAADLMVALALDGDPGLPTPQTTLVPLPAGMAVRRQYLRSEITAEPPDRTVPAATVDSLHLDYIVPVPHSDGAQLLLAFSTLTMEVADALTVLFDTIAQSLRWVP